MDTAQAAGAPWTDWVVRISAGHCKVDTLEYAGKHAASAANRSMGRFSIWCASHPSINDGVRVAVVDPIFGRAFAFESDLA